MKNPTFQDDSLPQGERSSYQEHTEFLRRLARGLLRDPGRAEDALQETWLVALRQRGQVSRGWLATVVRRVASQMRRGERRRLHREQASARTEGQPSASESVARLEVTAKLVQAVQDLGEPYRTVLLLRFFDDLSPQQIAARQSVPVATVHTQLRRGLERLRGNLLDDESTTTEGLLSALLPLAGSTFSLPPLEVSAPAGVTAASSSIGTVPLALLVNTNLKLCALALALLGLSLAGWETWGSNGEAQSLTAADAISPTTHDLPAIPNPVEATAGDIAAPNSTERRESLAAIPGTESAPLDWPVYGTVKRTYDDGYPNLALKVRLWDGYSTDGDPAFETQIKTDASGHFRVDLESPENTTTIRVVIADGAGHSGWPAGDLVLPGDKPKEMELHYFPLDATLTGIVTQENDRPVPGASVQVGSTTVEADEEGRFEASVASARDRILVNARAPGLMAKRAVASSLASGETREMTIRMLPEFRVTGRVTNESGAPLEGVKVSTFFSSSNNAFTDLNGNYELGHLDRDRDSHMVTARLEGLLLTTITVNTEPDGAAEQDFVLESGVRIAGHVIDSAGHPIPAAKLYIGFSPSAYNRVNASTQDEGRFEFVGVGRGPQTLVVERSGFAPYKRVLQVPETGNQMEDITIELGLPHFIGGTLLGMDEEPLAGISVSFTFHDDYIGGRAKTDENGRFRMEGLPADHLGIEFYGGTVLRLEELVPEVDREDLVFHAEQSGYVAGRVVDGVTGEAIEEFRVRIVEPELGPDDERGSGYAATWSREGVQIKNAMGHWDTGDEELRPGTVLGVEVHAAGYSPARLPRVVITPRTDPDRNEVQLFKGARVHGNVTSAADGAPLANASLRIRTKVQLKSIGSGDDPYERAQVFTNAAGAFVFEGVGPGEYHIQVESAAGQPHLGPIFEVRRSDTDVSQWLVLPEAGSLIGRLLDETGAPLVGESLSLGTMHSELGFYHRWEVTTTAGGAYEFHGLPTGEVRVSWLRGAKKYSEHVLTREFGVKAGEVRNEDLRPPGTGRVFGKLTCSGDLPGSFPISLNSTNAEDSVPGERIERLTYGTLSESGHFEFKGIAPGTYRIHAFYRQYTSGLTWSQEESITVTVTDEASVEADVAVTRTE